jgi:membrane associated rhomboid family serine protease
LKKDLVLEQKKIDKHKFISAIVFPVIFIGIIWIIKIIEVYAGKDFSYLGLSPLNAEGLRGILFFPLIHGSWEHLINNSIPLFLLSIALFYFYRPIGYKVFFLIYFIHGFWLWFFAREGTHVGASGLIYGLGSFIFTSGIIRKNTNLLAISLIVAFMYGSMVWGIFPLEERISWEGHLMGLVCGIILSFYFKNYGPQRNMGNWKDEMSDEDESDDEDPYWMITTEEEPENMRH